ncbi:MAG: polysaccharide pyruvyl transferase family protein [Methanofollis sp.]|nr:polysaccharide pyruvyl transferase family protein [Methanofollis sp.]
MKILVTGAYCVLNKGDAALRLGGLPAIRDQIPDANFTILTLFPEYDSKVYTDGRVVKALDTPGKALNAVIRCILWSVFTRGTKNLRKNNHFLDVDVLKEYARADVIVDISGDSISEVTGFQGTLYHLLHLWIATKLRKKTVIYAQSVGPFPYTKPFSKRLLNKTDLITLRGKISYDYLQNLKITNPPIYLTADVAFLMEPASEERIDEIFEEIKKDKNSSFVGISVSNLISRYYGSYDEYTTLMAKITDFIITELHTDVIFIPHVTGPDKEKDDRIVGEHVYQKITNKKHVYLIKKDYSPQETWGIIKQGELFLGARMHACIGALSVGVPVINISYHHKSPEIMQMFGLEENVIAGGDLTFENATTTITQTWGEREKIKRRITEERKKVRSEARKNAIILQEFLKNDH